MRANELVLVGLVLGTGVLASYRILGRFPVSLSSFASDYRAGKATMALPAKPRTETLVRVPVGRYRDKLEGVASSAHGSSAPTGARNTATPVEAPAFRFPTPKNLQVGASSAEIRAAYGEPTMHIAGIRNGRILERYYYVNKDHSQLTVATIENGVVKSAESLSSPYFELGNREKDALRTGN